MCTAPSIVLQVNGSHSYLASLHSTFSFKGSYNFTKLLAVEDMQVLNAHEADIVRFVVYNGKLIRSDPLAERCVVVLDSSSNLWPASQSRLSIRYKCV